MARHAADSWILDNKGHVRLLRSVYVLLSFAGATYPLSMTTQQLALRPERDISSAAGATIDGKPSMGRGRRLSQFSLPSPAEEPFLLPASMKL